MNKIEINAVVNAFLIECINNDDVGSIDCFKGKSDCTYYRSLVGRYKGTQNAFYIYINVYKDNPARIRIDTESKEALEFINSFNIYNNE